jgi:hypothetical protein
MRWIGIVARGLGGIGSIAWAAARRWPKVAMVATALLVFLTPLCVDLFFAIPPTVRKAGGWVVVAGFLAACLERLWRVEPSDDVPPADEPVAFEWTWIILPLVCGVMAVPYLRGPNNLGSGDWNFYLEKNEAVRRTVLEWEQFPWWDPWCRGGFPLGANPQVAVIGVATPLVLALGTSLGLRVAQLFCLLITMEGARRLAFLWFREPLAAVAAGLIYGINGAVLSLAVCGYHVPLTFCSFPWLLYYVFRLDRRWADGALLGFWLAFNVSNEINYWNVYALTIVPIVWLRALRVRTRPARARFLIHTVLAVGLLLAVAGWRLSTTGLVYRDFPRHLTSRYDLSPWSILMYLLTRPKPVDLASIDIPFFWETLWYVGPVVIALAAASLARGWRWWHTLTAACIWLAAGSVAWYHPSYWLSHFPVYAAMHVVTRWRILAMLGLALAVADLLARWRRGDSPVLRRLAVAAVVAIAADFVLFGCQVLHLGFRTAPSESQFPGPPTAGVIQLGDWLGFAAVQRGYGVIHHQEPLLGYEFAAPTARLWRGHPDYKGEFWTDAGPVRPRSWSPNRVVFQVKPRETVFINQNPGSWWLVNGHPAFPRWRCAETGRPFQVRADAQGRLELHIRPRGLGLGLALHVAGFGLIGLAVIAHRRPWGRKADPMTSG